MIQLLLIVGIIAYLSVVLFWDNIFMVPTIGMILIYIIAMLIIHLKWNKKKCMDDLAPDGPKKQSLHKRSIRKLIKIPGIYQTSIILIFIFAFIMRLDAVNTTRELVPGSDEQVYHYAAENLLKYGMLTYDRTGDMFKGTQTVQSTKVLSPGYPMYIALVYAMFEHSIKAVIVSQLILSLISFWLIYKILKTLNVGKPYIIVVLVFSLFYPGFYYNVDRMLTETLFTTLLMGFVYLFLRGLQKENHYFIGISAALLGCATHVRALAFPFVVLVLFYLIVYERKDIKQMMKKIGMFVGVVLLCMFPWWIRNLMTFHTFMLFSEAGENPKIWGAVPYFLDMGSVANKSLNMVLQENTAPNPLVFYKWRIFGFFQYMWGDIWDEYLVHPFNGLRPFLIIQQIIIVPCMIAIPLLIMKCRKEVIFISCIPIAFTLMNMPFHGLPRYVYPSVPFVLILFGVFLGQVKGIVRKKTENSTEKFLFNWQKLADLWLRRLYIPFSILFSLVLIYSVYFFAYGINGEMSEYRLSRYMGITPQILQDDKRISANKYDESNILIENARLMNKEQKIYKNDVNAPIIIRVNDKLMEGPNKNIASEVTLNIQGGYVFDLMTVYWTGRKTPEISENNFYKFPINPFQRSHKIYIDDDIKSLMIVPAVFRGGKFKLDSIEIQKYQVK
ncbi:glycosyltransferase family 39 protein [Paenibacillus ehimensis]|uniref:glycosyltransferase family 39 protein n=1 Tax=Paenibacillus ehimensis TaxID=79264 RepID=UPI000FDB3318|nr:glycosyltransferase family 39 protein [Paenibacillus ehimensis]